MTDTFSKLMSSIVTSSVWCEPHETVRVWFAFLAIKDRDGIVHGSIPGLANLCRVTPEQMQGAIDKFMAPDPYSRTPDYDGRRIEAVKGGYRVLNHDYYRELQSTEDRKTYKRLWQRAAREAARPDPATGKPVHTSPQVSTVDKSGHIQDADTDTGNSKDTPLPPAPAATGESDADGKVPPPTVYSAPFLAFWQAYPSSNRGSKLDGWKAWKKQRLDSRYEELMLDCARRVKLHPQWNRDDGRYIPHVSRYINGKLWEEELTTRATKARVSVNVDVAEAWAKGGAHDAATPMDAEP